MLLQLLPQLGKLFVLGNQRRSLFAALLVTGGKRVAQIIVKL